MKDIEFNKVVQSAKFINDLSFDERLKIYDRIFLNQPNIFAHVLVLSKVNVEDAVEADETFTVLMGDQVEPRKKFIEDHALHVRNLDV